MTTIRVPAAIDLTGLTVNIGDTVTFVDKFSATQSEFQRFSTDLIVTISDMQDLATEVEGYRDSAQAIVGFSGVYSELAGLPDLSVYLNHTGGVVTGYGETTNTNLTNPVLDFAAANVGVRDLTGAIAFAVANVPVDVSAKYELLLTTNGHPVDWTGIPGLIWAANKTLQPHTTDLVVFNKYAGVASIFASHQQLV